MPEIGQIVVEYLPGPSVVSLCGEYDLSTAPAVQRNSIPSSSEQTSSVDLSEATFIDSSVVGALFRTALSPGHVIALAAAPGTMPRRLIDMVAPNRERPNLRFAPSSHRPLPCRAGAKEGA